MCLVLEPDVTGHLNNVTEDAVSEIVSWEYVQALVQLVVRDQCVSFFIFLGQQVLTGVSSPQQFSLLRGGCVSVAWGPAHR